MLARARSLVSCRVMPSWLKIMSLFTDARMLDTSGLQTSHPSPLPWPSRRSSKLVMPVAWARHVGIGGFASGLWLGTGSSVRGLRGLVEAGGC